MTARRIAAAAAILALILSGQPARSDEECDTVMENLEDALSIASKAYSLEVDEITKKKPDTDSEKTSFAKRFCNATGEFLGYARSQRALANECLRGNKRRSTISSLEESIKKLEDAISKTCD
jgi:hypothetical protein